MVQEALKAHDMLKEEGIDARVINIHTIKPIDRDIIIKADARHLIQAIRKNASEQFL
jgi:transketolase C-terminal domain/subunit